MAIGESAAALVLLLIVVASPADAGLSADFYKNSCPRAESATRAAVGGLAVSDPTLSAALLRLAFHDCQVRGCDASILLDSDPASNITAEVAAGNNFGIRRLDAIDRIKSTLEMSCPGVVSCADIIAMAARDAIAMSGGPRIELLLGRRDGVFASTQQAQDMLLPATATVDRLLSVMKSEGFSTMEAVALLGAHTLGVTHCPSIVNRLYPSMDSSIPRGFGASLRLRCPRSNGGGIMGNATFIANDFTNLAFDNRFYTDILSGTGVLSIDQGIAMDARTKDHVKLFAANRTAFFASFNDAFRKLTQINVLTGSSGQVRKQCRQLNR